MCCASHISYLIGIPEIKVNDYDRIIAVYVKKKIIDIQSLNFEYLKYIGGQNHIHCKTHSMPLIYSHNRNRKCNCGRKETFSCASLNCTTCICQRCVNQLDATSIHQIEMDDDNNQSENESDDTDDDQLLEPTSDYNEEDLYEHEELNDDELSIQNNVERDGDILERDDFDEFVTSGDPPDIDEDFPNEDIIPTSNAGDYPFEIEEEIPTDRLHISGHVILN